MIPINNLNINILYLSSIFLIRFWDIPTGRRISYEIRIIPNHDKHINKILQRNDYRNIATKANHMAYINRLHFSSLWNMKLLLNQVNLRRPSIQFTMKKKADQLALLNMHMSLRQSVFCMPTFTRQYLNFSFHRPI